MKKLTVQSGPIVRTRKMERHYVLHRKQLTHDGCDFCDFAPQHTQVIKEYDHFWVVKNIFPYAVWDGCRVVEHNLVVPKRHVTSISQYDNVEKVEYMDIVSAWEGDGYCLYSRPHGGITKSMPHQHTHLIKIENKRIKSLVYNHHPHVLNFR